MAKVAPAPAKGLYRPRIASLSVSDRVVEAVSASKERGGMSLHVVKKTLAAGGYDVDKNKFRVKTAIKRLVAKGTLVQLKGTGAVGSFRINKDKHEVKARVSQPAKKPPDLLSGKIEYPEDWQQQEHSIKDGDSPFPVVWEVLNGLLWRRPITPSSSSADKEEEEDSLPAPTIEILFTPAMDQGQQTLLAETVVCIKEEPEDFEFEGCGDIPLPSQPGQNHTKTNTSASQPGHHLKQHSGEKPYSCSFCGKQFAYGKSCRTHERNHVAMGYQCSDCGETFREREQKDRHKCLVFKGETVFPCTECTEVFSRRYLLKKHQLEFHPEICVETSQSPRTEMDRMNPADTVDQAMDERKEEEEELFDPGELVPSSLGLLEMDEMVQPGFSCKW